MLALWDTVETEISFSHSGFLGFFPFLYSLSLLAIGQGKWIVIHIYTYFKSLDHNLVGGSWDVLIFCEKFRNLSEKYKIVCS